MSVIFIIFVWLRFSRTTDLQGDVFCQDVGQTTVLSTVDYHWLYRETVNQLDRYGKAVAQGSALSEALNFTRYLLWSGITKVLEAHARPEPLKVDGAYVRWKAEELQRAVQERFKMNKTAPNVALSELESINHKLDLIAGHISKLSPPSTTEEPGVRHGAWSNRLGNPAEPELRVVEGGSLLNGQGNVSRSL